MRAGVHVVVCLQAAREQQAAAADVAAAAERRHAAELREAREAQRGSEQEVRVWGHHNHNTWYYLVFAWVKRRPSADVFCPVQVLLVSIQISHEYIRCLAYTSA